MKKNSDGTHIQIAKYLLVFLVFALQGMIVTVEARGSNTKDDYILVINSSSHSECWSNELCKQIESLINPNDTRVENHELQFTSIQDTVAARLMLDSIAQTYLKKPQVIVMIYDPAWLLCKPLFDSQWSNVPVLLITPNPYTHITLEDAIENKTTSNHLVTIEESVRGYNVMVIKQKFFFQKTLSLMQQMLPSLNTIAFISDDNYISRYAKESFKEFCYKHCPNYSIDFLSGNNLSTDGLLDSLSSYDGQTGILYFSWQHKHHNQSKHSMGENLHKLVNGFTESPVFTLRDLNIKDTEFSGGCFISVADYSQSIVSIINQLVKGVPLGDIKVRGLHERSYLNYKNLIYSHVPTSLYPSEAIYYDTPPSFIEEHSNEMVVLVIIIIFAITLIVIRAIYVKKTNLFKEQDKLLLEQLQGLINNMPIGYARIKITSDPTTQKFQYKFIDINSAFESLLGCNRKDIIGNLHTDIIEIYPFISNIVENGISSFEGQTTNGSPLFLDKIHFHNLSTDILEIFCIDRTEREIILGQLRSSTLELTETNKQLQLSMIVGEMIATRWLINECRVEYTVISFDDQNELITHHICHTDQEYFSLIHPDDVAAVLDICQRVRDGHIDSINIEYRFILPQHNKYQWMQEQATTIQKDPNGKALIMAGVLSNIDHRKKMELKVIEAKESEKEYRRQLQLSLIAGKMETTKWDIVNDIFYYDVTEMSDNNELQNYQYTLNEAQYLETIHPDDRAQIVQILEMTKAGKRINLQMEYRLKKKGSSEYEWVETQDFATEFNDDGTPKMFAGIRRNINKRKMLELEMQQARARQEEHNRQLKLSLIARQMEIAVWDIVKKEFTYTRYSINEDGALTSTTKVLTEEETFFHIHVDDRSYVQNLCDEIRKGDRKSIKFEYRNHFIFGNTDDYYWTETHFNAFEVDANGIPTKMIGVDMNIDQRKNMEFDLIRAKEEAEESNRLKSAFLANMSHEIRTPLNAIVGFSDLLSTTDEPEERAEYLSIIKNNNNLLLQLIDDILNISRIEAGRLDFDYSEVNIHHLFCEMEDSSNVRQKNSEVPVVFNKNLPEYIIYTDRHRVMQLISNFINNAMKFTTSGSIEIGYKMEQDQRIYMYVKDTGCGISDENRLKVFDRFVKLDTFKQGTGLGLSICSSLIEKMNGEIGVDSTLGVGSTFWIKLPTNNTREVEIEPQAKKSELPNTTNKPLIAGVKQTILVAEDNESNYKLFELILKKKFHVLHAWNGQEAVDLYRGNPVDLILMDIKMPVMDGFEAIERIREIAPTVPVIAATASVFPAERRKIKSHGFNDFVAKPINSSLLMEMIDSYLSS